MNKTKIYKTILFYIDTDIIRCILILKYLSTLLDSKVIILQVTKSQSEIIVNGYKNNNI